MEYYITPFTAFDLHHQLHAAVLFVHILLQLSDVYDDTIDLIIIIIIILTTMSGPGKGMYSRLYRNVLALYPEVESALATNLSYNDAGVFVLQGSSSPRAVSMV